MTAYYNEIDPYCAQWLRNLIEHGHIAPGYVDERDIRDIKPYELAPYTQCHFFAGIGGWSYALHLANIPNHIPLWTGSCPCQPFSVAGKRGGTADERHLWPSWFHLISQCKPAIIFGEQVANAIRQGWLDLVFADLEGEGYACGAAVLPACSVGAPHIRQRLWFVADSESIAGRLSVRSESRQDFESVGSGEALILADSSLGRGGQRGVGKIPEGRESRPNNRSVLDDSFSKRRRARRNDYAGDDRIIADADGGMGNSARDGQRQSRQSETSDGQAGAPGRSSPWRDLQWLPCTDGKARPTQRGIFPLVAGIPTSLARMRAIENEAFKEIINYGTASQTDTNKVLRAVWKILRTAASRQEARTGMCVELHAEEVLLTLLFCRASTRNEPADDSSLAQARDKAKDRIMRGMQNGDRDCSTSCRLQSDEQCSGQPANALHVLSFVLACHAQAFWRATFDAHAADCRVGKLRAAGNAIIPQVAAEFIKVSLASQ